MTDLVFPDGFLWGAATSSYQVEGGNVGADWSRWEQAGGGIEPCGDACDSWNRWHEDIEAAVALGLGVWRISIEWSRVEPEPGRFDADALARYAEMLRTARQRGLQTMVVLWHFTNPSWLGPLPWTRPEHAQAFLAYTRRVVSAVGPYVDHWATINEANTLAWQGYIAGNWPPQRRGAWHLAHRVYVNLAAAHVAARAAIKESLGDHVEVGVTHLVMWVHPAEQGGRFSWFTRRWWEWIGNELFLDMVGPHIDWLGVQYYHDTPCRPLGVALDDVVAPRTDLGWPVVPEGLYHAVMKVWRRYRVPIVVTENGLADERDVQRGRFIIDHLAWLHQAISDGADVRGYLHWSLLDNYEWTHGFRPRFGLAEVDYETFERRLRRSGRLFGRIARANAVPRGLGADLRYADGTGSLAPSAAGATRR